MANPMPSIESNPWILLWAALTGFLVYFVMQIRNLHNVSSQNQKILSQLLENQKKTEESRMVQNLNAGFVESGSENSSEYQLPYFEDSDEEEQITVEFRRTSSELEIPGTGSSGYNTEQEVDYDWEYYKILRAPLGPVPDDQILLCFSCHITGFYVKSIVDKDHSAVSILTYEPSKDQEWEWIKTTCESCIQRVRDVLADGGCPMPFAMDLEMIQQKETGEESEDVMKEIRTFSTDGFFIAEPEYEYDSEAELYM